MQQPDEGVESTDLQTSQKADDIDFDSLSPEVAEYIRTLQSHVTSLESDVEAERHKREQLEATLSGITEETDALIDSFKEVDQLTREQSQQLQKMASEVSDFRDVIEDFSTTVSETVDQSTETVSRTERAHSDATDALEDIELAQSVADETTAQLDQLTESVDRIDEICDRIDDIAEQTNMLALNASIEAARVDGNGEGFAVVADEIKTLAEEAQMHAEEIEGIVTDVETAKTNLADEITSVKNATGDAVQSINRTAEEIAHIEDYAADIPEQMEILSELTSDHAEHVDDIGQLLLTTIQEYPVDEAKTALADCISELDDTVGHSS